MIFHCCVSCIGCVILGEKTNEMSKDSTYFCFYESPIGKLRLRANMHGLTGVDHPNQHASIPAGEINDAEQEFINQAKRQLNEYFAEQRTTFDVPLSPQGTAFQCEVWQALIAIPFGETRNYSDIAISIGNPKAVRAVGLANGKNPLSIFIPCHRVIGKNKTLTGYAGGLKTKRFLLEHEQSQYQLL